MCNSENPIIKCRTCGLDIILTDFTDNPKYGNGCGWDYKCNCGRTGFVWEGAFDCEDED